MEKNIKVAKELMKLAKKLVAIDVTIENDGASDYHFTEDYLDELNKSNYNKSSSSVEGYDEKDKEYAIRPSKKAVVILMTMGCAYDSHDDGWKHDDRYRKCIKKYQEILNDDVQKLKSKITIKSYTNYIDWGFSSFEVGISIAYENDEQRDGIVEELKGMGYRDHDE